MAFNELIFTEFSQKQKSPKKWFAYVLVFRFQINEEKFEVKSLKNHANFSCKKTFADRHIAYSPRFRFLLSVWETEALPSLAKQGGCMGGLNPTTTKKLSILSSYMYKT